MSMEYRKLPHGAERIGTLGVGTGGLHNAPEAEIEAVVDRAIGAGVNFFDLCAGGASVYRPFGRAMKGRREQVLFQLHFGAVYNEKGEYGWSRDRAEIARTFEWELEALQTDYADLLQPLPALPGRHRHRPGQQVLRSGPGRGPHGRRPLRQAGDQGRRLPGLRTLRPPLPLRGPSAGKDAEDRRLFRGVKNRFQAADPHG